MLSIWLNNIKYLTYWSFIPCQTYIPGCTLITDLESFPEWDLHLVKIFSLSLGLHCQQLSLLIASRLYSTCCSSTRPCLILPEAWQHLVNLPEVWSSMWPWILLLIFESQWSHKQLDLILCTLYSLGYGNCLEWQPHFRQLVTAVGLTYSYISQGE